MLRNRILVSCGMRLSIERGKVLARLWAHAMRYFLQLKALLEPFGITRFYTDGWGAYEKFRVKKTWLGKNTENRKQELKFTDQY